MIFFLQNCKEAGLCLRKILLDGDEKARRIVIRRKVHNVEPHTRNKRCVEGFSKVPSQATALLCSLTSSIICRALPSNLRQVSLYCWVDRRREFRSWIWRAHLSRIGDRRRNRHELYCQTLGTS